MICPPTVILEDLARFIMTVAQGTAVQASSGAGRDEVYRLVDIAMKSFPGSK